MFPEGHLYHKPWDCFQLHRPQPQQPPGAHRCALCGRSGLPPIVPMVAIQPQLAAVIAIINAKASGTTDACVNPAPPTSFFNPFPDGRPHEAPSPFSASHPSRNVMFLLRIGTLICTRSTSLTTITDGASDITSFTGPRSAIRNPLQGFCGITDTLLKAEVWGNDILIQRRKILGIFVTPGNSNVTRLISPSWGSAGEQTLKISPLNWTPEQANGGRICLELNDPSSLPGFCNGGVNTCW